MAGLSDLEVDIRIDICLVKANAQRETLCSEGR